MSHRKIALHDRRKKIVESLVRHFRFITILCNDRVMNEFNFLNPSIPKLITTTKCSIFLFDSYIV